VEAAKGLGTWPSGTVAVVTPGSARSSGAFVTVAEPSSRPVRRRAQDQQRDHEDRSRGDGDPGREAVGLLGEEQRLVGVAGDPGGRPAVVYSVYAVAGALVGTEVPTVVSIVELAGWPAAPPHWLHFESTVRFATSNTDTTECLDGWLRHSRDIGAKSTDRPPVINWLAHVRGVIKDVIT
jgi:hypothetical protein